MTVQSAAALDRLDDGVSLPGDDVLIAIFDRHCVCGAQPFCLICGEPGGPECGTCTAIHDHELSRLTDI